MMVSNMTLKDRSELLATLWDDSSVTLLGVRGGVVGSIDRDQAVDGCGMALYDSYQFLLPYETDDDLLLFSAEDLGVFAWLW